MGSIAQFFGFERKSAEPITTSVDLLRAIGDARTSAGETVNEFTALQVSAVMCCARVIAEGLAQVPCKVYKEDGAGSPVEAKDHPLYFLLNRKPNDWQTSFEFREQIGLHLALRFNAYIYKNKVNGRVAELYALQPNAVEVKQHDDLTITYLVTFKSGRRVEIPADDIWHIKGPSLDGITGLNAVQLACKTIGLAQATETFGSKLFENGARPGGMLTTRPGAQQLTQEQRNEIKKLWAEQHSGATNAHKTIMLPFDLEFTPVHSTANEAQWIENRKFLIEEICRFFRVQPIMVMQSGATSYASVEQLFLNHLMHTLMPWYERFEQSAEVSLLTRQELLDGYSIKLSANALLRASHAERATFYQTMRSIGAMTANEVRAKEDMPRSNDPTADQLAPAANIFGGANKAPNSASPATSQNNNNNEVEK
ncbi:phage portal protein [Sphingomonas xinjiangensis]|uniref:HK97 family phage portal protein n=1 Tax=Sphingomonas xinjiangensis TaxID=643568 RepID=A0A840YNK1_9SPHN|nr:phage portal protein [Sphingomonas xinjiangensis]MBB5709431.1 HK97 family phage portal protein [Sphingomonas xinjiangensis]